MRKNVSFLIVFSFFLAISSCGESKGIEDSEGINIPKTTGMLGTEAYYAIRENDPAFGGKGVPVMNAADREKYKIASIPFITEKQVVYGKLIHQTATWRMVSILGYTPDHIFTEYFIFYDKDGKYLNGFEIGSHRFYGGDLTETEIEGNQITCKSSWSEPGAGGTNYTQYELTPQFTLKELKKWSENWTE